MQEDGLRGEGADGVPVAAFERRAGNHEALRYRWWSSRNRTPHDHNAGVAVTAVAPSPVMDSSVNEAVVGQVSLLVRESSGGFLIEFDADAWLIAGVQVAVHERH